MTNGAVVVAGSSGFLGRAVVEALTQSGHEVWGLDQTAGPTSRHLSVDLLDAAATRAAFDRVERCKTIIHLAALAHGQEPPTGESCYSVNTKITENILQGALDRQSHLIFASSIAVYGEDGRRGPVGAGTRPRPSTEYGSSKRACEEGILRSALKNVDILRIAPVFDKTRLNDVRKRVSFGRLPLRFRLYPPPDYSLCSIQTMVEAVGRRVARGPHGRTIQNIADARVYSQHELATWFSGPAVPIPVAATDTVYLCAKILPGALGHRLRSLYCKLFRSNTYSPEELSLPPGSESCSSIPQMGSAEREARV